MGSISAQHIRSTISPVQRGCDGVLKRKQPVNEGVQSRQ